MTMTTLTEPLMSKVSLRRLLSRLTALALTTSSVGTAAAASRDADVCDLLDADLPIDREQVDAHDAGGALGRSLAMALDPSAGMAPLRATHLASTWALSDEPLRRLAVANALTWTFPLVGDDLVIDHLSHDPDPAIRAATARAAWARRATGGDPGVLARLSHDPDLAVRTIALAARA